MSADGLPPRRNGRKPGPADPLPAGPEPDPGLIQPDKSAGDDDASPIGRLADPNRQRMPAPYRYPAAQLPPAPPAPQPGEVARTCGFCGYQVPLSHLAAWGTSFACTDLAACQQRQAASGLYPQPAEAQ